MNSSVDIKLCSFTTHHFRTTEVGSRTNTYKMFLPSDNPDHSVQGAVRLLMFTFTDHINSVDKFTDDFFILIFK